MARLTGPWCWFKPAELDQLRTGSMWAGAANQPVGEGDPVLERAEAAGLLFRTERGFELTDKGRAALAEEG